MNTIEELENSLLGVIRSEMVFSKVVCDKRLIEWAVTMHGKRRVLDPTKKKVTP